MKAIRPSLLLLVALVLAALPAVGEEGDAAAIPFAEAVAALPAPSAGEAFDWTGEVLVGDGTVGTFRLAAEARDHEDEDGGPVGWYVVERWSFGRGDEAEHREAEAWLDERLSPRRGRLALDDALGRRSHTWERDAEGLRIVTEGESQAPMERRAKAPSASTTTLTALLLFARLVKLEAGAYEVPLFDPGWEYLLGERPFTPHALRLHGRGRWQGRDAWTISGPYAGLAFRAALETESRGLLALELRDPTDPEGPVAVFRPGTGEREREAEEVFTVPATTPRAAALRTALAFLTGDEELFAEVIHWPRLREHMKESITGTVTDEAFRTAILGQFRSKRPPPQPRAEAEAFLRSIAAKIEVAADGEDEARVTYPAELGQMKITLARVDGVWYLVALPS